MGADDFVNGRAAQNLANRRASADADEAVGAWKDFSTKLQGKLQKTEFDFVEAATQREGLLRLVSRLKDEVKRLDPNNPLLREDVRSQIYGAGVADKFRELGYTYDSARGVFHKPS